MERPEALRLAAAHWTRAVSLQPKRKRRWWESPACRRYINELVDGVATDDLHGGFHRMLAKVADNKPIERALSVGCGEGGKEMALLAAGIVDSFDLYEITPLRIEKGLERARALGLSNRIRYHLGDAFEECKSTDYDMVYWNNSLHHMLDTDMAIAWSLERLADDGLFAMDDFVGPSRFQWTDRNLEYASRFRKLLPEEYLRHPDGPPHVIEVEISRPSVDGMISMDPTEAADSSGILPSLRRRLPHARVVPTGGCIYSLALNDVLAHFSEIDDLPLLNAGLLLDRTLIDLGETHYAVAVGCADGSPARGTKPSRRFHVDAASGDNDRAPAIDHRSPSSGEHQEAVTPDLDIAIEPHKAELVLRAVRRYGVKTFADLGACRNVNAGYTLFLLGNASIQRAYAVDQRISELSLKRGKKYNNLSFVGGHLLNEAALIEDFPQVDALIMCDTLLHQVNLDWDEFLTQWSKRTNILIIHNQMWSPHAHTVRLINFGPEWYKKWVPYSNETAIDSWFDDLDAIDPVTNRQLRDSHAFWQWGITRDDLIKHVESLGFRLEFFEDYGPATPQMPWLPRQGFVFRKTQDGLAAPGGYAVSEAGDPGGSAPASLAGAPE